MCIFSINFSENTGGKLYNDVVCWVEVLPHTSGVEGSNHTSALSLCSLHVLPESSGVPAAAVICSCSQTHAIRHIDTANLSDCVYV